MKLNLFKAKIMQKSQLSLFFIFTMLISVIANPIIALAADEDYTIESLYLSIRPEYDQPADWVDKDVPAVLVVNQLVITNNTDQPITTISYPAPIDEPNFHIFATGKLQSQGQYWPAPHVLSEGQVHIDLRDFPINPDEDYTLVVQYYYNPFTIDGVKKSFTFEYAPEFTVKEVLMNVVIPQAAKNVRIEPVKYALEDVKEINVNKDNPISVNVMYDKADNRPTNQPLNQGSKDEQGDGNTDMLFILFVALLLIIVIIFIFSQKDKSNSKQSNKQKPKKADSQQLNSKKAKPSNQKLKEQQSEEQKDLRKKLLTGEIDEKTYHEQMKKLNNK